MEINSEKRESLAVEPKPEWVRSEVTEFDVVSNALSAIVSADMSDGFGFG
jgi:hypothetical protein